jgi:hypothetical protein
MAHRTKEMAFIGVLPGDCVDQFSATVWNRLLEALERWGNRSEIQDSASSEADTNLSTLSSWLGTWGR